MTITAPATPGTSGLSHPTHAQRRGPTFLAPLRFEIRKLVAQRRARAVLVGTLALPPVLVVIIHGQARPPKDTLFGRFATDNGFALALLVLGFAAQWVLPLLTALVAGDIFASEDQHGTWKTVLTRSTSRSRIFWAKTLVAAAFAVLVLAVLATSTIGSSLLIVNHDPLIGLSGQTVPAAEAWRLVALSWASVLPALLGFTCLAILLSVWSRNPAAGIAAPVVLGMVMQLVGSLGGAEAIRPMLLSTPFEAWHGLLALPRFTGPVIAGLIASLVWCVLTLLVAFLIHRRRDITGG